MLNIPTVELAKKAVKVGILAANKFKMFELSSEPASEVEAPLLTECYANLECKVIDTKLTTKYNIFILQVLKAWIRPTKKKPRMFHHCGKGVFVTDGEVFKLPFSKM